MRNSCLNTTKRLCVTGAAFALALLFATKSWAAPTDGWKSLLQNHNAEARAAFRQALRQNPADSSALHGLAVLCRQEDANVAALQAWRAYYHVAPSSWQAAAWWPEVIEIAQRTGRWDLQDGLVHDILAAKNVSPELRASARLALADAADRAGRPADANAEWARMGFARQWHVIGPFDNVSRSGFDKAFPPEGGLAFGKTCPGKDDRTLAWYRLAAVSRDGQCKVGSALGDSGASVFYASTAVYSPNGQTVVLRFGPTGASKVWVNGRRVFSDSVVRVHQPLVADEFRAEAQLRQGWNTLLVKIADDEKSDAAFALRLTSPAGADLNGLQYDPGHRVTQPADSGAAQSAPAEPALTALIRIQPASTETILALGQLQRRSGDYQSAIETYKSGLERSPDLGWLHSELWTTFLADGDRDEALAERDMARKLNPRIVAPEVDYLLNEKSALAKADTIKRLRSLLRVSPDSSVVYWALCDTYHQAKMTSEAIQAARAAVRDAAGPEDIDHLIATYQTDQRDADAKAALSAGLRNTPNSGSLLMTRAGMLEEEGQIDAAMATYQKLLAANPSETLYRKELATLYRSAKNLIQAAKTLDVVRLQRPQDGSVCAELGDILKEQKRSREAAVLYREAIRLDPSQVELREKLQIITGEQPGMSVVSPMPAQPILAAAKAAKGGGASAIVFLDEERQLVYPDFATVSRFHKILKVFDQSAVEHYTNYPLSRPEATANVTIEEARILKPDGKIQDVNASGGAFDDENASQVSLPSLAPGDIIDISYRVDNFRRGVLSKQFWTQWFFSTHDTPVKLSRFVVITPPGLKLQLRNHGTIAEPATKDLKGWRIREWRMTDIPACKTETLGTGLLDSDTWLDISTVSSWSDIVRWYRDLSSPLCVPDTTIRAKAAELTREASTEDEKIRAIASFVRSIQYQTTPFRLSSYIPTEGKQVLRDGYADCKDKAALLTALLKAVNIHADMVLLSGRSYGITPYLPSTRFNHAIAVAQTAKGPLWMDTTADNLAIGSFPFEDQGVPALVINDATTDLSLTASLPIESNRLSQSYDLALNEDGKLSGTIEIVANGNWAWLLRTVFKSVPETNRDAALRSMEAAMVSNSIYESGAIDSLDNPDSPLGLRFKFHVDSYSAKAGNFLLVKLPWSAESGRAEALLSDPARTQDVELAPTRGIAISTVRLRLPQGYAIQELQPETSGDSAWGSYRATYRMEENVLRAEFEQRLSAARVPVGNLRQYLDLLRNMAQEVNKQFVLKKLN